MHKLQQFLMLLTFLVGLVQSTQESGEQPRLVYDSEKAPVRIKVYPSGNQIEVTNHSDLKVEALTFACVSEAADGKVSVKRKVESIASFDLKHIELPPADRNTSTFSFFSFPVTDSSVQKCKELGLKLAVVKVLFADDSSWKIPEL